MSESDTYAARISDDELKDGLERHQAENDHATKSDTARYLMRRGLEVEGYIDPPPHRQDTVSVKFAAQALNFASTALQVSILSLATALLALLFAPGFVGLLGLFTAATGLTSIFATVLAAIAARVEIGEVALTERILAVEDDSGNGSESPADPAGGD